MVYHITHDPLEQNKLES